MRRLLALGLLAIAVAVAGCNVLFPIAPAPTQGEASDDLFRLFVRSPLDRYPSALAIHVAGGLAYQGPKNRETIFHAASPIGWRIVQLDGPAEMGGGMDQPCLSTVLDAGRIAPYPFQKAGEVDDAPPFDLAWYQAKDVHLPAGRWRFIATMDVSLGDCGGEMHQLEASIDVTVTP